MKKTSLIIVLTLTSFLAVKMQAQVPAATWRWNFNQTNLNSTNYIFPTIADGTVPVPPQSSMGVLRELDGSGNSVNLLGADGSGVSSGTFPGIPHDRAILEPGVYGANSYMVRTPDASYAINNWPSNGVITSFTLTCWVKQEATILSGQFPRVIMFGANGQDAGSAGLNSFGLLFFNNGDLQLKIHNASNPNNGNGMSTSGQPLASAATNWAFIAVTYDGTLPSGGTPTGGTNTIFYFGTRNDSLLSPVLSPGSSIIPTNYYATSINSVAPGSTDSPGFINFSPTALNGDGSAGVSNVFVAIGNRYQGTGAAQGGGNRAFNGRYDDFRLFVNQVLTRTQIEAVRTDAPPGQAGPLTILAQPQDTTIAEGQGAAFSVVASEAANRTYQWYVIPHGVGTVSNLIAGATGNTLETTNLTVAGNDGDKYMVIVHSTDPASDNSGAGAKSIFATAHVLPATAYVNTPGMLKFELYNADSGTSVGTFLGNPTANYTNNTPDLTLFMSAFDSRTIFPTDSHLNYFGQVSGWITPTVTTNYVFYIRASDQADLFLSTDDTTNNLVRIAADFRNGPNLFFGSENVGTQAGNEYSTPIPLIAGTKYAVQAHVKTSSGQNLLQVAWRMDSGFQDLPANDQNLSDRLTPIPASVLSTPALPLGTVSISQQPTASPASTASANSKVTLSVGITATTNTGAGQLVIQWQRNGINIDGATGPTYTTPYLTAADNGAQYGVVASVPGASATSSTVTLTVNPDATTPTVLGASSDDIMHSVTVQFSEPVDPVTALNPANYSIPGLTVSSAAFALDTNLVNTPTHDAVKLTTSTQADNTAYTVTVTGVTDTAAHTIGGGNKASFTSFGYAPGFGKFEYFEDLTYFGGPLIPADDNTVNGMITYAPKFINNDPDTIVYPRSLEMSPAGGASFRSGSGGLADAPPGLFGTRMSAIITPTNTGNYVFYLSTDDTGILWLSTDDNPTNKHAIAYSSYDANSTGQTRRWSTANSAQFDTNSLAAFVTAPGATFWPVVDGANIPIITLTNGQRYYLEVDQRETLGFSSASTVNWDNASGVAPADGSATALTGNVIGWHFPQPQISSLVKAGNSVNIAWTNGFGRVVLGAAPWPGVNAPDTFGITPSFPTPTLQVTTSINPPMSWTSLTNNSPATIPMTNSVQFFRVGE